MSAWRRTPPLPRTRCSLGSGDSEFIRLFNATDFSGSNQIGKASDKTHCARTERASEREGGREGGRRGEKLSRKLDCARGVLTARNVPPAPFAYPTVRPPTPPHTRQYVNGRGGGGGGGGVAGPCTFT